MRRRAFVIPNRAERCERYALPLHGFSVWRVRHQLDILAALSQCARDGQVGVEIARTSQCSEQILHSSGPPNIWNWRKSSTERWAANRSSSRRGPAVMAEESISTALADA